MVKKKHILVEKVHEPGGVGFSLSPIVIFFYFLKIYGNFTGKGGFLTRVEFFHLNVF